MDSSRTMDLSSPPCGLAASSVLGDALDAVASSTKNPTPSKRLGGSMKSSAANSAMHKGFMGGASHASKNSRIGAAASNAAMQRSRPLISKFVSGRQGNPMKSRHPMARPHPVATAPLRRPILHAVVPIAGCRNSASVPLRPSHGAGVLSIAPAAAQVGDNKVVETAMHEATGKAPVGPDPLAMTDGDRARIFSGVDAEISRRDWLHKSYCDRLINGRSDMVDEKGEKGPMGLMARCNTTGEENVPYDHQRLAVKWFADENCSFLILGHDMGLGKTATLLQMYASVLCTLERATTPKAIISVPSATIDQWLDASCDWLTIPRHRILVTTRAGDFTRAKLLSVDLVIVSRDCVATAFAKCYSRQEVVRETTRGNRKCVEWLRTPGTELHPIFAPPFDKTNGWYGDWALFGVDEAHYMRNGESRRCEAHHHLAKLANKVALLSGTFIVNGPLDLAGLCKCGNAPRAVFFKGKTYDLQDVNTWTRHRDSKTINKQAVELLRKRFIDRATEKILNLPVIDEEAVNFEVCLDPETAARYNSTLAETKALKARIERQQNNRATAKDLTQLMALLQLLQQYLVSPVLAREGAEAFKDKTPSDTDPKKTKGELLYEEAAVVTSGSIDALMAEIEDLMFKGHRRIVVAANHVVIMRVAMLQIQSKRPQFGTCFIYKGGMERAARVAVKKNFLNAQRAILFLSIGAGGVGLHLVPGCEAILFWGSMPFSPAHRRQAMKRIHRIGQTAPITGKVTVRHLIAHGSVDNAIGVMHGDKDALIQLVQEGDDSGFGGDEDSQWRKTGRIVDAALPVDESGAFPPMPMYKIDPKTSKPLMDTPFTLLPKIKTRGREELAVPSECRMETTHNNASNLMSDDVDNDLVPVDQATDDVVAVSGAPLFDPTTNLGPPPPQAVAAVQAAMAAQPANPHAAAMTAIFEVRNLSPQQRLATMQALGIMI